VKAENTQDWHDRLKIRAYPEPNMVQGRDGGSAYKGKRKREFNKVVKF
jgi:hypothetical protein